MTNANNVEVSPSQSVSGYVPTEVIDPSSIDSFHASNRGDSVNPQDRTELAAPSTNKSEEVNSAIPLSQQPMTAATSGISVSSSSRQVPASDPVQNTTDKNENAQGNLLATSSNFLKSQTGKTLSFALLLATVATSGVYFTNYRSVIAQQEKIETTIGSINEKYQQQKYQLCYEEAEKAETKEITAQAEELDNERIELAAKCRLEAAEKKASLINYEEAIAIARLIPDTSPNSQEVQEKLAQWSNKIIQDASQLYNDKGDLKSALEKLDQIPDNSGEAKKLALSKASEWKTNDDNNKSLIVSAKAALESKDWTKASETAKKVQGSSYWKSEADKIIKEANQSLAVNSTPAPTTAITSPPAQYINTPPQQSIRKPTTPPKSQTTYTPPTPKEKVTPSKPPVISKPAVVNVCPGILCNE